MNIKKIGLILATAIVLVAAIIYGGTYGTVQQIEIDNTAIQLEIDGFKLKEVTVSQEEKIHSSDHTSIYKVRQGIFLAGTLKIVEKVIDNGDKVLFFEFINASGKQMDLPVTLTVKGTDRYDKFDMMAKAYVSTDEAYWGDVTTNVKGIYNVYTANDLTKSMLLSHNYVSKKVTEENDTGNVSKVRQLIEENQFGEVEQLDGALVIPFSMKTTAKNDISESWMMISAEPLFENESNATAYKEQSNAEQHSSIKWLTINGAMSKLHKDTEPALENVYGRNVFNMANDAILERYQETEERFYYNLLVVLVNKLVEYKESGKQDAFVTEYTSGLLKEQYNIQAPYINAQENEVIHQFLYDTQVVLQDEALSSAMLDYADFLVAQRARGNVIHTRNGYYITDYMALRKNEEVKKSHASLKQIISKMNVLFEAYKVTNDEKYKKAAVSMLNGLEDLGDRWVNPATGEPWGQTTSTYEFSDSEDKLTQSEAMKTVEYLEELNITYKGVFNELVKTLQ
ncbi:hypothetical protein AAGS61_05395 [Lysinibacillus sp. KU-BSD001]|uniref:hypothetical protein n=1 Tax=Lysinibacillus sp. KU-BSD001 TaxID=3141328 RepID=UPI0036E12D64